MKFLTIILIGAACLMWTSCNDDTLITGDTDDFVELRIAPAKVTGDVEVYWNSGGQHGNNNESQGMNAYRSGLVDLAAFEPKGDKSAKGHFDLKILKNNSLEREIKAKVIAASVSSEEALAWFLAEVYFDTKPCDVSGGNVGGGSDDHDHDDGHDPGCSGGDDHGGGCSGGDDHGDDHSGGSGGNGHVSGRNCRIGQIIAVEVFDGSSPGVPQDEISWRWFRADAPHLPDINNIDDWPHLCNKTILSGNLVVH